MYCILSLAAVNNKMKIYEITPTDWFYPFCFYVFLQACGITNSYKDKVTTYLTTKGGSPLKWDKDSTGEERLSYSISRKIHNPTYSHIAIYKTYHLTTGGKVYKQKRTMFKRTPPMGKPTIAIE